MDDNPPISNTPERRATWRMGARQRERLQWTVVAIICLLLIIALRPYYLHIIAVRNSQTCQSNMLQITRGLTVYGDDYDNAFPLAETWQSSLEGYLATHSGSGFKKSAIFHCPEDSSGTASSYAMNDLLSGYSATHQNLSPEAVEKLTQAGARPDRIPLIFEKPGSQRDAHFTILDWDALARLIALPHDVPKPSAWIITGGLKPTMIDKEKLATKSGLKF